MENNLIERAIRGIKTKATGGELIVLVAVIAVLSFLTHHHIIELPAFSCQIPVLDNVSGVLDMQDSWDGLVKQVCATNSIIKIAAVITFSYLLLCVLLICSPLKASPVMYFSGIYLLNEKEEKPQFNEALKLILFSRNLLPLYFAYFYCYYHNFTLSLHQSANLTFLFSGLVTLLLFIEMFGNSEMTWDERISGLRIHLTEKKEEKLREQIKKQNRWYYRVFHNIGGPKITIAISLIFWGCLAINILREGVPPQDYDEVLYKRAAPIWEDNAYFALAGLDAPEGTQDFYEYGRQEVVFNSKRYTSYKKEVGIPYTHEVPEIPFSLYHPDKLANGLTFDSRDLDQWSCLYDMGAKESSPSCVSKEDVLNLIDANLELWRRFRELPTYSSFSIPDLFLESYYSGEDLIGLVKLNNVYILDLQAQGLSKQAMGEWQRYMELYLKMVNTHSSLLDKSVFLVALGGQFSVLETLFYNDPQLAVEYGSEIHELLDINDVAFFGAGEIIANDWRITEPLMLPSLGSVPYQKRLMYKCIEEYQRIAALPAGEYLQMQDYRFCKEQYPTDLNTWLIRSISGPGNFASNMIHNLLMGGMLKGGKIIGNMHKNISDYKMALVAVELIKNKVSSENVQDYLNAMPEAYWNPITKSPFLWDKGKQMLYYANVEDPGLAPSRMFRVKLVSD